MAIVYFNLLLFRMVFKLFSINTSGMPISWYKLLGGLINRLGLKNYDSTIFKLPSVCLTFSVQYVNIEDCISDIFK